MEKYRKIGMGNLMDARACSACGAPLGLADEVCELGHHTRADLQVDLAALRSAVDEAFSAAESQVALLARSLSPELPEAPPSPLGMTAIEAAQQPLAETGDPARASAPPFRAASAPPPPPPPPPVPVLYAPLPEAAEDRLDDPITAFAPAARLDWGPERTGSKAESLRKRFNR